MVQPSSKRLITEASLATTLKTGTLTDGQLLKWDATVGQFIATNPTGSAVNAEASNTTGVVTSATSATAVVIPGTAISVTNSGGRPVRIEFEATVQQTVAGTGTIYFALAETTSGVVNRRYSIRPLPGIVASTNQITLGVSTYNAGIVTTTRTFALYIAVVIASGTPNAQVFNQATHPTNIRALNG